MRLLVAALLAGALVAGCAAPGARCEPTGDLRTPWIDGKYLATDPRQPWDTLVVRDGGGAATASAAPAGWSVQVEDLPRGADGADGEEGEDGDGGAVSVLRVTPGAGMGSLALDYRLDGCEPAAGQLTWPLMAPAEGASARPGQGVHVHTAGFWENGTLFYTNIEAVDRSDWPRAAWYAWEGGDPLPVYVYADDRSEQPAVWADPQAGTPLQGTVPGLGYFTTIPGFNEALKGLSTTTVRVARLAPEEGYTRAGNEEHPLYGAPLVFYIKVVDVVDLPCPAPLAGTCGLTSEARA